MPSPGWRPLSQASSCLWGLSPPHFDDVRPLQPWLGKSPPPLTDVLPVQGWSEERTQLLVWWDFKEIGCIPFLPPHFFQNILTTLSFWNSVVGMSHVCSCCQLPFALNLSTLGSNDTRRLQMLTCLPTLVPQTDFKLKQLRTRPGEQDGEDCL